MTEPKQAPRLDAEAPTRAPAPRTPEGPPLSRKRAALLALAAGSAIAGIMTRAAPAGVDPSEQRQPQAGGRGTRSLSVTPDSYNADAHTVEAVLSAGSAVRRYYFTEELEISEEAINLGRVTGGICPLLDTHNQFEIGAVIGRILSVRIKDNQLIGVIQFSETEAGQSAEARVARGELRAISIGYHVTRWQITATDETDHETWRAVAWELLEASLVPVPADPNAVVRSAPGTPAHGSTTGDEEMRRNLQTGAAASAIAPAIAATPVAEPSRAAEPAAEAAPAAQAQPAADALRAPTIPASRILDMCGRSAALGSEFASELIRLNETTPLDEAGLLSRVNERLLGARPTIDARAGASGTESDGYRQALEDAVTLRSNPNAALTDERGAPIDDRQVINQRLAAAREFRGLTMMEQARDYLQRTGITATGMGRLEVAGAALGMRYGAMTTSDFANALSTASNKRVRAAFTAAPQTFRQLISTDTLPDFKPASIIGIGDAPALLVVPENGEFQRGALTDTGMFYKLTTYGRIIAITRQAIVNDDQGLFGRIPTQFGRKAADLESDLVWGMLISNPVMADGVTLFHANHGNLSPTGDAITVASVGAGETAMLQQVNAEGGFLTIRPEFLIVGPKKKVEAQQFLTAVAAAKTSDVNPYPGNLTLIVEPRITGNQWFLAASPDAFDTIVLAHLLGQEELFTDTRVGFDVDGVENKARLDVGAAVIDHRGFYKNPGN